MLRRLKHPLFIAAIVTGLSIAFLTVWGQEKKLDPSAWASWVQAVGSVSAILFSMGLVAYQADRQGLLEQVRAAQDDVRVATFANSVVLNALEAIRATEGAQKTWRTGIRFVFNDRARIESAQILVQNLTTEPLFEQLIGPVMATHTLLVEVASAAEQLDGQSVLTGNSNFVQVWKTRDSKMKAIERDIGSALTHARTTLTDAEKEFKHFV